MNFSFTNKKLNFLLTFTLWSTICSFWFKSNIMNYVMIILILYGKKIMSNQKYINVLVNYYNIDENIVLYFHYCFHYFYPFYFLYINSINIMTISEFFLGIFVGILYSSIINLERVYFVRKQTVIQEVFTLWCILYTISRIYFLKHDFT